MCILNPRVLKYGPGFIFDESTMVKIDRSTRWGNPYIMGIHGDRDTVCDAYLYWLNRWIEYKEEVKMLVGIRIFSNKVVVEHLHELKGKDLVCWCAPNRCHGEVLLALSNKYVKS